MFFDFNGGIAAVARTIVDGKGIYNPKKDLIKDLYEQYLSDSGYDFTQLVRHNITTVLNNLLFSNFKATSSFLKRWRKTYYDFNIIPRRYFSEMYDIFSDKIFFPGYKPNQFVKATERIYKKLQTYLTSLGIESSFSVFTGLVYYAEDPNYKLITDFLRTINFIEVIEAVPTDIEIYYSRRSKHAYYLKTSGHHGRRKTSACVNVDEAPLTKQDRFSRSVHKKSLQYSQTLCNLDLDIYLILDHWDQNIWLYSEKKLKQLNRKTRDRIINLVAAELNVNPKDHRAERWQSIIKASYADLQSYELLQELDQYLQEL